MNLLYLDVETTGLDPKNNSIIQLSGILKTSEAEIPFDFKMKPYHNERMSKEARAKTGISSEEAYSYPHQSLVFDKFVELLSTYITSYDTKAYLIGYNVSFDDSFMREWFELNNAKWGYMVWFPYIDVMTLAGLHLIGARPHLRNFQLTTVYNYLTGHDFENAHDAMADIKATKEIFEMLTSKLLFEPESTSNALEVDPDEIPF